MGLHPEATEEEIRKAYRRLALQWHPDRNPGNPRAADRFREISEAYAVLIDPAKRRAYDRARRTGIPSDFGQTREDLFRDLFADPRASAIFEELAREFQRMGMRVDAHHFHQTLFGGRGVVHGGVIVITPFTPLVAAFRIGRAIVRGMAAAQPAATGSAARTAIGGASGLLAGVGRAARWFLGTPASSDAREADVVVPLHLTRAEADAGGQRRVRLPRKRGAAEVLVTVPPGIRSGTRLRLRGQGVSRPDGSRGDVYLAVVIDEPR